MMDDNQRRLLDDTGVIILPEEINHAAYEMVLEACLLHPDRDLQLYCRGDGGDSRTALAIVDVIRSHGKVIGMLAGVANSSHAIIFAGCPKDRRVFRNGLLGLHRICWTEAKYIDANYAQLLADEFKQVDDLNAKILAVACNEEKYADPVYWRTLLKDVGSRGVIMLDADFLVLKCRMAVRTA